MPSPTENNIANDFVVTLESFVDGEEDKAGINAIDVLVSTLQVSALPSETIRTGFVISLGRLNLSGERIWYGVSQIVRRLEFIHPVVARALSGFLQGGIKFDTPKARYNALIAYGAANSGLLPSDIESEQDIKRRAPGLWLDLLLIAHEHDASAALTKEITALTTGLTPILSWERLSGKLSEIRRAYGSSQYKAEIQNIARSINDRAARISLLEVVDAQIGTSFAEAERERADFTTETDLFLPSLRQSLESLGDQQSRWDRRIVTPSTQEMRA